MPVPPRWWRDTCVSERFRQVDCSERFRQRKRRLHFFETASLFRQGKTDEARKLATEAAAKMRPLLADEKNPLAAGD
jgi:hypothetical protein